MLDVQKTKFDDITQAVEWLVPSLRQGRNAEKIIIFCRYVCEKKKAKRKVLFNLIVKKQSTVQPTD